MDLSEHLPLTIYVCPSCGLRHMNRYDDDLRDNRCPHRGDYFEAVQYVPYRPRGAVSASERCPRDSDWCDGVICRERGIDCPNADPVDEAKAEPPPAQGAVDPRVLALARWTQHLPTCARATSTAEDCTCGLQEAWIALEADTQAGAVDAERLARQFHEAYERLAPDFGYETRRESAVPWDDVPEQNKALMVAVCTELLRGAV